jgi:hypothetical protein
VGDNRDCGFATAYLRENRRAGTFTRQNINSTVWRFTRDEPSTGEQE